MKKLFGIAVVTSASVVMLLTGPAEAGLTPFGVVAATPEKNSTGDTVAIDATGNCAEFHPTGTTLIVTVTGPDSTELDRREFPDASDAGFDFSATGQTGTYTVTADCDVEVEGGDPSQPESADPTDVAAAPAAIEFSYESDTFEVIEPDVSATRVFTNDPSGPTVIPGVISGRPNFTG